nr:protein WHI4 [Tanacetum cinerariifolium]
MEQTKNTVDGACSTLLIANLGPKCNEAELRPILSKLILPKKWIQYHQSMIILAKCGPCEVLPTKFSIERAMQSRAQTSIDSFNAFQVVLILLMEVHGIMECFLFSLFIRLDGPIWVIALLDVSLIVVVRLRAHLKIV